MAVALSCQGLWKVYEMGDEKVQAVRGIDLEINSGEMVAIWVHPVVEKPLFSISYLELMTPLLGR